MVDDELIDKTEFFQFKGKWKEAIAYLTEQKKGIAVAALFHPQIGEIDLVWGRVGDKRQHGLGLSKIIEFHPEVVENMQPILQKMKAKFINDNDGWKIKGQGYKGSVRVVFDNEPRRWLMTLFEKEKPVRKRVLK